MTKRLALIRRTVAAGVATSPSSTPPRWLWSALSKLRADGLDRAPILNLFGDRASYEEEDLR